MAARALSELLAEIPPAVLAVWDQLNAHGESFLVGGAVRDLVLGRAPRDYDIATPLDPSTLSEVLDVPLARGGRYGSVRLPGMPLEVVAMRRESGYSDRRRPDEVRFGATILEDLARRDFTLNAMALGRRGALTDPHGGMEDIARGRIRTVGEARARLSEDLLRVLRAYRLAAELGYRLAPSLRRAVRGLAAELSIIAPERVGQEMQRLLEAPHALPAVRWLGQDGVLQVLMPFLHPTRRDFPTRGARLLALCLAAGREEVGQGLLRLGWPAAERRTVVRAVGLAQTVRATAERARWREAIADAGPEAGELLAQVGGRNLAAFARLYRREGVIDRRRLPLRGAELARAEGLRPEQIGRREQELLRRLWQYPGD